MVTAGRAKRHSEERFDEGPSPGKQSGGVLRGAANGDLPIDGAYDNNCMLFICERAAVDMLDQREIEVRIAMQIALLGEVSSTLRAVMFSYGEKHLELEFYYDGEISYDDEESASCVETELIARFPEDHRITCVAKRLDWPKLLPQNLERVYRRREQRPPEG